MIAVDWVSLVLSFAVGAVYGGTLIAAWLYRDRGGPNE